MDIMTLVSCPVLRTNPVAHCIEQNVHIRHQRWGAKGRGQPVQGKSASDSGWVQSNSGVLVVVSDS